MSSITPPRTRSNDYPTRDGRPMAESDVHRDLMVDLIQALQDYYAGEQVYVSGNLLLFYEPGNRRKHVSPDVFIVKGVNPERRYNYLIWEERRGPDFVIELTSASTRDEDVNEKMVLYRDVLRVPEYFLFDPRCEYLDPPLQGYRLRRKRYMPVKPVDGRLPSEVTGLHLERDGRTLRLYNPAASRRLLTRAERVAESQARAEREHAARLAAENEANRELASRRAAEARAEEERAARLAIEAELERVRRKLEQQSRPPEDQ